MGAVSTSNLVSIARCLTLELLQNASDAAHELHEPGFVRIELNEFGLIVANTGKPFSINGVGSLQTSHLSPKRHKRTSNIGNKGLGFRSVMNWSRRPIILSGALRIAYSLEEAEKKLTQLVQENEAVAEILQNESSGKSSLICPVLPFPAFSENGALSEHVHADALPILERCEELLKDGYVTVIGMPFDRVEAFEQAQTQLAELQPEFLLFSSALTDITIVVNDTEALTWSRNQGDADLVRLTVGIGSQKSHTDWHLFRKCGFVPDELLREKYDPARYDIVIALPHVGAAKPSVLYSHFPTEISFPFPVLCHVTLELEQNRKRAQKIISNAYVLEQLAEHLAEVAERMALDGATKWSGIDLITPQFNLPSELSTFAIKLIDVARSKQIVPTLSGDLICPVDARLITVASTSWLPTSVFNDVASISDPNHSKCYRLLRILELGAAEFVLRVNSMSGASVVERADVVSGVILNKLPIAFHSPTLLLDSVGEPINVEDRVFIPPEKFDETCNFPAWAKVRLLHSDMWSRISAALDKGGVRNTRRMLESFGVHEYALAPLIANLVSSCNRSCDVDANSTDQIRSELIDLLFAFFPAEQSSERRPAFPSQLTVQIQNQKGRWADVKTLYLGEGFPPFGKIVQQLYFSVPEKLVSFQQVCGLSQTVDVVRDFLLWIGCAEWPRIITGVPAPEFLPYALQRISFPAVFGDTIYKTQEGIESPSCSSVVTLDGIDSILRAPSITILAWLAKDLRSDGWRQPSSEHGKLCCVPYRVRYAREYTGPVPSYIHWKLRTTVWLHTTTDELMAPEQCMLGDRSIEGIFPRPKRPDSESIERLGLDVLDYHNAWYRAGVPQGLSYLESEEIYALLYELGRKKVDGKVAKRLYRWLLESSDFDLVSTGTNYSRFVSTGKIWGCHGATEGYFPIRNTWHIDYEGFPLALLEKFPIADLPKKRGNAKVKLLFGLKCIDRTSVKEIVEHHVVATNAGDADASFQKAKPFLLALRQSQTAQPQQLDLLGRIHLEVSTEVTTVVSFSGNSVHNRLQPWHFSINDNKIFIACDPSKPTEVSPSLLADAVGAAVASIFGLTDGSPFAQLFQCDHSDRRSLLVRLLGEDHETDADSLLNAYGVDESSA